MDKIKSMRIRRYRKLTNKELNVIIRKVAPKSRWCTEEIEIAEVKFDRLCDKLL